MNPTGGTRVRRDGRALGRQIVAGLAPFACVACVGGGASAVAGRGDGGTNLATEPDAASAVDGAQNGRGDGGPRGGTAEGGADAAQPAEAGAGASVTLTVDGRPFSLFVPAGASGSPAALLVFLHHFGGSGTDGESDFGLQTLARTRGFLYAAPDGTSGGMGHFWDATDACCDPSQSVNDSGYLSDVIATVKAAYAVDAKRVFVFGHSNGAFMAYRLACDHADQIAAFASVSGAMWQDASKCAPSRPVSVVEVHATQDPVIGYDGGVFMGAAYPSATTSVRDWAGFDACSSGPRAGALLSLSGSAATTQDYAGCGASTDVALWSVDVANHLPFTGATASGQVVDWLFSHASP